MRVGGLLLLCLIWAWASIREDMLPGSTAAAEFPPLAAEAMLLGLFAGLAGAAAFIRKAMWPRIRGSGSMMLVGIGLFVVPSLLTEWSEGWIGAPTRVALFSLAPIFAVVFEPYLGDENEPAQRHAFAAALVAVVGTLLVFPVDLPQSAAAGFAFVGVIVSVACVSAANCLGVRIASRVSSGLSFAAITAGSAAVVLGVLGAVFRPRHSAMTTVDAWSALDPVALVVLFWLMGRMSAVRMTTRFVIAPLLANLIGIAFLRPSVDTRGWTALVLIATGSGWLLLAEENDPQMTSPSV